MGWAAQEIKALELGGARRTHRLIKLVDDLSAQPTGSIPLACGRFWRSIPRGRWSGCGPTGGLVHSRRDRDRDPGAGRAAARRSASDWVAVADPPDRRDPV